MSKRVSSKVIATQTREFKPVRLESQKLTPHRGDSLAHGHLSDVSGKRQLFENIDFSFTVITRGYFHQAEFKQCNFTGARFTECNFRNATFKDCDFSYADFDGCRVETDEILENLPDLPNVRRELLQILRKNALSMGDVAAGRAFVIAELSAKKEHLRRAWAQDEAYYKRKYGGFRKTMGILVQRSGLWMDDFLWGHGEKLWKLPISMGIILLIVSAAATAFWLESVQNPLLRDLFSAYGSYLIYYVSLFLDVPTTENPARYVLIDWAVVIFRYVSLGILVSGLFRWLSHR